MPRRRSKGRKSGSKSKSKSFESDGKLKKWNTISDIPMDEEDQCASWISVLRLLSLFKFTLVHASKDKILLNGDHNGGYDDDGEDDEVFALKGIDDGSEEDFSGFADEEVSDNNTELETEVLPTKNKTKRSPKAKGKTPELPQEEEEEEEGWGRGRAAYYSSNADQLESDDEEGNELEEQEAIRLQTAMRKEMTDDDFGLNDSPEGLQKDDMEYDAVLFIPFAIIVDLLQAIS